MNREELIEQAAKAMADANPDSTWEDLSGAEREWYMWDALAALAVFEQAHTPTDDEREAQFVTDADLDRFVATAEPIYQSTFEASKASKYLVSDLGQWVVRLVAEVRRLRRAASDA